MQPLDKNISREYDYFMALSNMTRVNQIHPKIVRYGHGFQEYIDTNTAAGYAHLVNVVENSDEVADELIDELNRTGEAEYNPDGNPRRYESYEVLDDGEWNLALGPTSVTVIQ